MSTRQQYPNNVHLLIDTGRASSTAACDSEFANGQPGEEDLDSVTCPACLAMFGRKVLMVEAGKEPF